MSTNVTADKNESSAVCWPVKYIDTCTYMDALIANQKACIRDIYVATENFF